jgi:selenide,water dikinase
VVTEQMAQLNRMAAELMIAHGAHAATDITGYGLLGHAYEMAAASHVTMQFESEMLPLLPQVRELAQAKMIPGGANANREFLEGRVRMAQSIDPDLEAVLYDPQTSGGLLIALSADKTAAFESAAEQSDCPVWCIGTVMEKGSLPLVVK